MGESFSEFVKQETPRLVVMFAIAQDGSEQFQWGIVGNMPILTLVSAIRRGVMHLMGYEGWQIEECPEQALVIAYGESGEVKYFAHPSIPDSVVGMLSMIENTLIETFKARQMAAQQLILGPDGRPIKINRPLH